MQLKPFAVTLMIPLALSACNRSEQPAPVKVSDNTAAAEKPGQSAKSEFASRLAAAKGIGNLNERDLACSKLAIDAAAAGDEEVTEGAVRLIAASQLHDETASKAGLRLAKAGKGDGANAVVKLIGDSNLQDQARARIAKGEYGP